MRGRVSLSDPTSADIWRQAPMMALEAVEAALLAELAKSLKEDFAAVAMDWLAALVWSMLLRACEVADSVVDAMEEIALEPVPHAAANAAIAGVAASRPGDAARAAAATAPRPAAAPGAEDATIGSAAPMATMPAAATTTEAATRESPAPSSTVPAASSATPAAATATPAPSAVTPAAATRAPGPSTSIDAPSARTPTAADAP